MSAYFDPESLAAGLSTGLRTFTALAVTLDADKNAWTRLVAALAAGELVGDKLPVTPPRTMPPGLIARGCAAALCGALIAGRNDRSRVAGALLAAGAATAAAFAGYHVRTFATAKLGIPDALVALAEDGVTVGLARLANS